MVTQRGGKAPGTYAHWQVALAFAQWLSPEFHMAVNEVYKAYSEANPALAADIVSRSKDSKGIGRVGGIAASGTKGL